MKASTCYVLQGACTFVFGTASFSISSGQQAELPAGAHQFQALGSEDVDLVMVWKIHAESNA
jgi:mannose-6-phosphate isomerase-like protein (cupin superfamily)